MSPLPPGWVIPVRTNLQPSVATAPLTVAPGHPLTEMHCAVCGEQFKAGDEIVLVVVGATGDNLVKQQAGLFHSASSIPVHVKDV